MDLCYKGLHNALVRKEFEQVENKLLLDKEQKVETMIAVYKDQIAEEELNDVSTCVLRRGPFFAVSKLLFVLFFLCVDEELDNSSRTGRAEASACHGRSVNSGPNPSRRNYSHSGLLFEILHDEIIDISTSSK